MIGVTPGSPLPQKLPLPKKINKCYHSMIYCDFIRAVRLQLEPVILVYYFGHHWFLKSYFTVPIYFILNLLHFILFITGIHIFLKNKTLLLTFIYELFLGEVSEIQPNNENITPSGGIDSKIFRHGLYFEWYALF